MYLRCGLLQHGSWSDGCVHRTEHSTGANALRGRRRHVPDGAPAADSTTSHGPDRGTASLANQLISYISRRASIQIEMPIFTRVTLC